MIDSCKSISAIFPLDPKFVVCVHVFTCYLLLQLPFLPDFYSYLFLPDFYSYLYFTWLLQLPVFTWFLQLAVFTWLLQLPFFYLTFTATCSYLTITATCFFLTFTGQEPLTDAGNPACELVARTARLTLMERKTQQVSTGPFLLTCWSSPREWTFKSPVMFYNYIYKSQIFSNMWCCIAPVICVVLQLQVQVTNLLYYLMFYGYKYSSQISFNLRCFTDSSRSHWSSVICNFLQL